MMLNRFVLVLNARLVDGSIRSQGTLSYERIEDAWKRASRINTRKRPGFMERHWATIDDRG